MRATAILTVLALGFGALAPPARARGLTRDRVNAAEFVPGKKAGRAVNTKAQVLLDRANFSPGAIDGHEGDNYAHALRAFQKRNALEPSGRLDAETWDRLKQSSEPALIEYTVSAVDAKGPFVEAMPDSYEEKAKLKRLDYAGVAEMLAERFHMDQDFLEELNRGKDLDKAGTVIVVANVAVKPVAFGNKAAKIEADKGSNTVRVLAKDGTMLASYPASIGGDDKPAPSGTLKVVRIAHGPSYTYDPDFKFRGVTADSKLRIAAGPNNPVGLVWIALNQRTYGIHGTAEPSRVGKADSHGCVRMTNWDALAIARIVRRHAGGVRGVSWKRHALRHSLPEGERLTARTG